MVAHCTRLLQKSRLLLTQRCSPKAQQILACSTTTVGSAFRRSFATASPPHKKEEALDMAYSPVNGFQMNQYVIACTATRQAAIIDCGASTAKELDAFLKWIKDRDYNLTAVWQTHAHLDHIAGLGLLFRDHNDDNVSEEDVPIYLHEKERKIYNGFEDRCREFGFQVEGSTNLPKDTRLTYLNDDSQQLSLGQLTFDIIQTPGHSPGHIGFWYDNHFFGGDFIMQGSIGRTDFPTSNHADMEDSLERFVKNTPEVTIIFPGHGPPTSLKEEKSNNPFLQNLQ
mmetsp:Transcript_2524/g.3713  ORF Transcript_2524/g.3713 Transcript_2524/m.3713 type:complete len:283 (-) Transcript_2524:300-1148(-)